MEKALKKLWIDFEMKPFPLSNSATDIRIWKSQVRAWHCLLLGHRQKREIHPTIRQLLGCSAYRGHGCDHPNKKRLKCSATLDVERREVGVADKSQSAVRAIYERSLDELDAD